MAHSDLLMNTLQFFPRFEEIIILNFDKQFILKA